MSKLSPIIQNISQKIELLNQRTEKAEEEKMTLKKMIGDLSEQLDSKQQEIEKLEEENGKLRMANSLSGGGEAVTETKLKINELVREIDKCIALLNG